jgi:hypothetical protein
LTAMTDMHFDRIASLKTLSIWILALVLLPLAPHAVAQSYDLTMDVLVNSSNTTGYNTSQDSPGEYQRYVERYLEHLQIPYRVIDTATQTPPANLGSVQLIVAAHTGLALSSSWQAAILQAVQGGSGFVNFDADPVIGTYTHIQGIFGTTGSAVGACGTQIIVPSSVMPDGASPHYIAALQLRFQDTPSGDLVYTFHKDSNSVQQVATPTLLQDAQGTVIAKLGASPLILATQTSGGRAVDFTTYDFMHPDRFGFMMGVDDLIWRSLVWAARKPFILRGYPHYYASQMDDEVVGWGQRLQDLWNTDLTGTVNSDGTGGPWKVTAMAQLVNLDAGGTDRTNAIANVLSGNLKIAFHTISGISEGNLYWNPQSSSALTDAQWQTNLAYALQVLQGNGGSDTLPRLSKSMVPHFWNLSNNVGYDIWNSFGTRYITEIQEPGAYYSYGPPKLDSMRIHLRPFRIYELPPTGVNPNELYPLYYADYMTVGSTAGLPSVQFFSFATQLLGDQFPSFDARWPNDGQSISVQESVNNFTEYAWRFWSGMAPVQIYNHDGGSFDNGTDTERQQAITQISSFLNAHNVRHLFMEDLGAYFCARTQSALATAQATPTNISLNFTGNAADMDGNLIPTTFYVYYGDNEGVLQQVPGFTGGYSYSIANSAPPAIGLSNASLTFGSLPEAAPISVPVTVSNTGSGTLTYTAQSNTAWLSASAGTGIAPDTLTVTVNPSSLAGGVYTGAVQIIAPGAINTPQSINVTFNVQGPTLAVSATSLSFTGFVATSNPAAQNISISNNGAGTLNWTASSSVSWLQLGATSGATATGSPYTLSVTPNISGLQSGTYTGTITISSPNAQSGSPQVINVTLVLTGIMMQTTFPSSTLDGWAFSPLGLASGWSVSNNAVQYSGVGATQLYAGSGSWTNYTVQAGILLSALTDYPGGIRGYINPSTGASYAAWLYPAEGVIKLWRTTAWNINSSPVLLGTSAHVTMDNVNWHTLALSMNSGQIVASYDGTSVITVTDTTLSSGMIALDVSSKPIQFDNVLVTGNQAVTTTLSSPQSNFTFTVPAGSTSATQALQIATNDSSVAAWSALSPSSWVSVAAPTGQTPGSTTVQLNASALTAGTYSGQLNLASFAVTNSPIAVPITVNVTQPSTNQLSVTPVSLSFDATTGASAPAAQVLTVSSTASGLAFTVSSDSTWLTSTTSGSTPTTIQVTVSQTGLAEGTYTGHLTLSAPAALNPTTTVTVSLVVTSQPTYTLMQATFPNSTLDGWAFSPQGLASGWTVSNNTVQYNGGGATQLYAGSGSWSNYTVKAGFLLPVLTDYPGGIRGYINPSTGASYAAWVYPAEGVIKLWRTTSWNINTSPVLLGTSAHVTMDNVNWHTLALSMNAGQIVVSYDGTSVISVTDTTLSAGMIALDVSNKPIQFNNVLVTSYQTETTTLSSPETSYTFTVPAGSTSATQALQISTNDASVAAWSALSSSSWVTVASPTGQTPGSTTVQINASTLTAGTYSGQLNLASFATTNSPIAVPITVSVTAPSTNQLSVSPTSLSFSATSGAAAPVTQTLTVSSSVSGLAFTVASDSAWLTSTTSGTTPASVQVTVSQTGIAAGTYTGHLTLSAPTALNPTTAVTVTLVVANPSLIASPASLNFVAATTASSPTQTMTISNTGASVNWTAAQTSTWFSPSATSGTTPSTIQTVAATSGMAVGTYADTFTVTPAGSTGATSLSIPLSVRVGTLLFSDNFTSNLNWTASPLGHATNWTVASNTYSYNGGGATQQYAGSNNWTNYTLQADITLSTMLNYPGGLRFRLNTSTGSGYALWLYPANSQVKLLKAPNWNIDSGSSTLGTASKVTLAAGKHHLRIDVQSTAITVWVDYVQVLAITDSSYAAGAIALDVSNQTVTFSNLNVVSF